MKNYKKYIKNIKDKLKCKNIKCKMLKLKNVMKCK